MVASLDGFIAKKDNTVSWFETVDHYEKGTDITKEETENFLKSIDCYVMGSRTYAHALALSASYGWPYGDTPVIVLSGQKWPVEKWRVELYAGGLEQLVNERLKPKYNNVWIVGGAALARSFIQSKLVDKIRLSIIPIILGEGKRFFEDLGLEQPLHLADVHAYKNGMVELCYDIKR